MPIDKAIEAMKIHHQWLPDMIFTSLMAQLLRPWGIPSLSKNLTLGIIYDPELEVFIGANDMVAQI